MGEFKKGGVPVGGLLPINVGKPVVVDYFGNIGSDVILLIGASATIEELNSPMPKAIRRFKITGKSVGPSTLTAPGVNVSVVVSLTPEQQFIEDLATAAVPVAKKFGVPPSVVLGVACVESFFGKGPHAKKNLFGITKKSGQNWFPSCARTEAGSTEAIKGQGGTTDSFCMASSQENNAMIFCEFVTAHPNGGALKSAIHPSPWSRTELERYPIVLHDGMNFGMGNSTDAYRKEVMGVIDQQNLTRFDS